jgi:hypothetical protein
VPHKDIVIVPVFSRPEMLWFCLDRLAVCPEIGDMDIRVYIDAHDAIRTAPPRAEIENVLGRFPSLSLNVIWRRPHAYQGNTFNVMTAYDEAYHTDAEFVYLVEDDVAVNPDFFAWHRKAQAAGDWVCSIASRSLKAAAVSDNGYATNRSYASIGVCWRRANLAPIVQHANAEYFRDMIHYIGRTFRDGRADQYTEQDGLIERIISRGSGLVVWPSDWPRCHHLGWYGYHRWNCPRPTGSLEQRYEYVKRMAHDPSALKVLCKNVIDVEPVTA